MSGPAEQSAPLRGLLTRRPHVDGPVADAEATPSPVDAVTADPPEVASPPPSTSSTMAVTSPPARRRGLASGAGGETEQVIEDLRVALGPFLTSRKQNATISLPVELLDTLRRYTDELSAAAGIEVPYRAVVIAAVAGFFEERHVSVTPGYRSGRL